MSCNVCNCRNNGNIVKLDELIYSIGIAGQAFTGSSRIMFNEAKRLLLGKIERYGETVKLREKNE